MAFLPNSYAFVVALASSRSTLLRSDEVAFSFVAFSGSAQRSVGRLDKPPALPHQLNGNSSYNAVAPHCIAISEQNLSSLTARLTGGNYHRYGSAP